MRGTLRRGWPLFAVAATVAAGFWLLYAVWRSPDRSDLSTYGAFAVAVVVVEAGWIAWAWQQARRSPAAGDAGAEHLDCVADVLAEAVQKQWDLAAGQQGLAGADPISVAWGTPSLPVAGPAAAAAASQRFDPLPGLPPVGEAGLAAGRIADLHALYGGLRSGRLVIAGPPGSGKSGAAVLLTLASLQSRKQLPLEARLKVPVPVLFTAHDWDPRREPVGDWLVGRLQETYPLFTGIAGAATATALIAAGKIAVIVDGLDEITEQLRATALQAFSQQASFRIVVLSRTTEMASSAAHHGVLQGAAAIELCPIDPEEAARYLERVQLDPPPQGWRDLTERIRSSPSSPLSKALDSPLTLTLVRDTYQAGDDVSELLDFCDITLHGTSGDQATEEITGHLLDRVLPAAYAHRPGQPLPRYQLQTAQHALIKIAARMNQDDARDLQWWRIPEWVSRPQRIIVGGLVFVLVTGLTGGLVFGLAFGLAIGIKYGIVVVLTVGLMDGVVVAIGSQTPHRIGKLRPQRALSPGNVVIGLVFGLLVGLPVGLRAGVPVALACWLLSWLVLVLVDGLPDPDSTTSSSPALSMLDARKFALVLALVLGLAVGLTLGLMFGLQLGLARGLRVGLTLRLTNALTFGCIFSDTWPLSLAAVQLAWQWHTPVRLVRFLDDARERGILRTVGPVYQFRHASLQDRLAAATTDMAVARAPRPAVIPAAPDTSA